MLKAKCVGMIEARGRPDLDDRHLGFESLYACEVFLCNFIIQKTGLVAVINCPVGTTGVDIWSAGAQVDVALWETHMHILYYRGSGYKAPGLFL